MRWFGAPLLLLPLVSGCAIAPTHFDERLAQDPLACARRVAESIPPREGRNTTLNFVAMAATTCDPEVRTPPGYWSHDPDQVLGVWSGLTEARDALVRGDTTLAVRHARRAWNAAGRLEMLENRRSAREQATLVLVRAHRFDEVLGRAAWVEIGRERGDECDPTWARSRVAREAARVGDTEALARAQAVADSARGRIAAGAALGFADARRLDAAARALADIPPGDSLALGEARRGLALPFARAGRWREALAWSATGPGTCVALLRLDLLSLAHDTGRVRFADSLAAEVVAAGGQRPPPCDCGAETMSWVLLGARVSRLARSGYLAQADALVNAPRRGEVDAWEHALAYVSVAGAHLARGDRAGAQDAWSRAQALADSSGADAWVSESGWSMLADSLGAAGWTGPASAAIRRALSEARRCEHAWMRAAALAHVARRGDLLARGEDARLLAEAMREVSTVRAPSSLAEALSEIGATYRDRRLPVAPPERKLLAEIAAGHAPWTWSLSE